MNKNIQYISESIPCGLLLALAGGAMDSYSYIYRGKVFANAQTGNFLLLGVNLASGNYEISLRYFWPILAFILGIAVSDFFKYKNEKFIKVHWKQLALILEALMLFLVSFIPANYNNIANSLISFSCALQVESFRMLKGNQIATTMCVGNIRSATSLLNDYYHVKDKHLLYSSFVYIAIILAFVLGAILESFAITYLEKKAILISVALLIGYFSCYLRIQKIIQTINYLFIFEILYKFCYHKFGGIRRKLYIKKIIKRIFSITLYGGDNYAKSWDYWRRESRYEPRFAPI